jgi:glycosyltransferase involved in cell wall biosynthesis
MLGYPGYLDAFAAWPLARLARKPLVLDVFMSIYLISEERGLTAQSPFTGSLIKAVEKLACRLPDLLISDTAEYVRFYGTLHGLAPERFRLVPTGADDRIYRPAPGPSIIDGTCRVVYYGTFIPNHGTLTIVQAAHLLADERHIHFDLIGDGPDRAEAESFVQEFGLSNVSFRNWMSPTDLSARVARADICLGVFGTTPQSLMTIQNKIYEGLAMARPVISGDSPTVRSALTHGEHIWLCERADPAALANAIRTVSADRGLQQRLSQQGHDLFRARYSVLAIGRRLANHLEAVSAGER